MNHVETTQSRNQAESLNPAALASTWPYLVVDLHIKEL